MRFDKLESDQLMTDLLDMSPKEALEAASDPNEFSDTFRGAGEPERKIYERKAKQAFQQRQAQSIAGVFEDLKIGKLTTEEELKDRLSKEPYIEEGMHDEVLFLTEYRDELELLTPAQVCGLLNMNQKTLDGLKDGPKRITIVSGAVIRYRASEVARYLLSKEEP